MVKNNFTQYVQLKCSLMQLDLEGVPAERKPKPKDKSKEKLKEKPKKPKERKRAEKRPTKEAAKQIEEPIQVESSSAESEEQQQESASISQEEIEVPEQQVQPEQRHQFSALELIQLFDDDQIDDASINDLNLLSSLFIELKRLNQVAFLSTYFAQRTLIF